MFWKDLLPLWQKTCKLPSVWLETVEKHCQKQCFGRISYIYIYICWSWLPALEHGKIEENTVNSSIFNGWGDKGIGSIVEHDVFDRFYGDKSVKYRALKETIAKNMETHSKNTGFGGLSRRRCLAIWNSAAWRASKGGKNENSIAWEAVTAGKSENSLASEAPTGGKSENSLAWGGPTGGESENS